MWQWQDEQGLALIVAIAILLVFAIMAVVMTSLVSTDSDISLYQFRSGEALYIALGGQQYTLMQTYPNYSRPPYSTRGASQVSLGSGGFTVDPPAVLSAAVSSTATTIPATCFNRQGVVVACNTIFPGTGRILIESELIDYTGVGAGSFTGATRGVDGSLPASHVIDQGIYHATGLTAAVTNAATTIPVGSTTGFVIPGTIKIDQEFLYCTGTTATSFTGCTRGVQGSQAMDHNALATAIQVTIVVKATVSTGLVGNAQRILQAQTGVYRDGWAVANGGTLVRWNGINWDTVTSPVAVNLNSVFLLDANSDGAADDGWAVGEPSGGEVFLRWNGLNWTRVGPYGGIPDVGLNSVFCINSGDCWAVGDNSGGELIVHWNGVTWSRMGPYGSLPNDHLYSIYCVSSADCWAVGDSSGGEYIAHWNGVTWSRVGPYPGIPNVDLYSIYCVSSADCWAVGVASGGELIVHWDGVTWTRFGPYGSVPNVNLNSVYCVSTDDCWVVGNNTGGGGTEVIAHWDGATWTRMGPYGGVPDVNLNSVYCVTTNDCWAMGNPSGGAGVVVHWDGTAWSQYSSPTGNQLNEVFMIRPQNFVRLADWQEVY